MRSPSGRPGPPATRRAPSARPTPIRSWTFSHCRRACVPCRRGHPVQCLLASGVVSRGGVLQDGTSRLSAGGATSHHSTGVSAFAEEAVVPAAGAIRVDPAAPLDVVSLVGCGVANGVGAVRNTARVEPGSSVVVLGCGGVGLSVVQGARLAGAGRVVAVDLRPGQDRARPHAGRHRRRGRGGRRHGRGRPRPAPGRSRLRLRRDRRPGADRAVRRGAGHGRGRGRRRHPTRRRAGRVRPGHPRREGAAHPRLNDGGIDPARDIPRLVQEYLAGDLLLDPLVSRRRPLEEVAASLDDLARGGTLRELLIP
ncbi:S-(hydroxymethyl)glutathione dehydrogenase / alcohol dehydrogenase [Friedmanniella luteola]|uniref:S-(Hydroxymethyl)glutathione dehydrogenase / alcohol dehydrogenase n=1 Tax=Friedmanniella luteola TaxID=546871 RepID=A0A1H1W9D7_9ACTN|nr:S-(hydroxymethyl)glutathione dehydrogenase / alcohol dehydrogenase [Friedmanniella luteola]